MCSGFTWNVELGWVKPVELQVEAKLVGFGRDQSNQVEDRYGAWTRRGSSMDGGHMQHNTHQLSSFFNWLFRATTK